jgi:hypothetical protein
MVHRSNSSSHKPSEEKAEARKNVENVGSTDHDHSPKSKNTRDFSDKLGLMLAMLDDLGQINPIKNTALERQTIIQVNSANTENLIAQKGRMDIFCCYHCESLFLQHKGRISPTTTEIQGTFDPSDFLGPNPGDGTHNKWIWHTPRSSLGDFPLRNKSMLNQSRTS